MSNIFKRLATITVAVLILVLTGFGLIMLYDKHYTDLNSADLLLMLGILGVIGSALKD